MAVSAIKHLERMRGSKVTREEYHRLTMMQQALNLQDDDAVWMLFLAMEYQKAYYEQLPKKISDTTSELLKRVRETADREAAKEQLAFYKEAVDYNISTRDAYQEQFILGQSSLLDVLDAENELFNSSSQAATAHGNALIAAYRLKALTGELIPSFGIRTAILKVTSSDHEPLDSVTMPE